MRHLLIDEKAGMELILPDVVKEMSLLSSDLHDVW